MGIQLPQRGQPIDYTYLYQLVEQVNSVSAELSRSKTSNTFDNGNPSQARDNLSASDTKIVATTLKFTDNMKDTKDSITKTISFGSAGFLYNPVVTVTPQIVDGSSTFDLSTMITSITPNSVTVKINYNYGKKQDVVIILNVLAIGVRR
jgi:hypothetical protein